MTLQPSTYLKLMAENKDEKEDEKGTFYFYDDSVPVHVS
jgi:hypothetical protein